MGRYRPAHFLHVTVIGTATTAEDIDVGEGRSEIPVLGSELLGVTVVQLYRFVEFGVGHDNGRSHIRRFSVNRRRQNRVARSPGEI